MNYRALDKKIIIEIPASNNGKFRFKKRENNLDFGESFSTRDSKFDSKVYLEWQIGYDVTISDLKNGKKETNLKYHSFIGDNKKEKYPYELSEFLFSAIKVNLIPLEKIKELLREIANYSNFISDKKISVEHYNKIEINGVIFEETSIKLPTFYMTKTSDNTQIEISIQKQQYASGVQPMLYFCIPFNSFENNKELLGRSSLQNDKLIYIINEKNVDVLINIVKIFSMCSKRHNHDICEILKIIIKLIEEDI